MAEDRLPSRNNSSSAESAPLTVNTIGRLVVED